MSNLNLYSVSYITFVSGIECLAWGEVTADCITNAIRLTHLAKHNVSYVVSVEEIQ